MKLTEDEAKKISYNVLSKLKNYKSTFGKSDREGFDYLLTYAYKQDGENKIIKFYFGDSKMVVIDAGVEFEITSMIQEMVAKREKRESKKRTKSLLHLDV